MECGEINCVAFTGLQFAALLSLRFRILPGSSPARSCPSSTNSSAFARNAVRLNPVDRYDSAEHVLSYAPAVCEMCQRLEKPIYPGPPELQKRIRRRMTKVAQLNAHASQQIINLQGSNDLAATACDAVVCRLCLGLWRFIGIKSENATPLKR